MDFLVPLLLAISSTSILAVCYLALRLRMERQLRAEFAERIREQARKVAPDSLRCGAFFDAGLPVTFQGVDYFSKADADSAIDVYLAGHPQ